MAKMCFFTIPYSVETLLEGRVTVRLKAAKTALNHEPSSVLVRIFQLAILIKSSLILFPQCKAPSLLSF